MSASALLPQASTPLERHFADATDFYTRLLDIVSSLRGLKLINPPPSFLPFLVYEYGLGELTPYVPNLYNLLDEGIDWQRVRGTPASIAMALNWVGYSAAIEEFPTRRRHWNWFMLAVDRVRDNEEPDISNIEGVAGLSVPVRSVFWRGFHGYDVRALEWSRRNWSSALYSTYSGVRIGGQAKWSFGRLYDLDYTMTQAELEALGAWIEPTGGVQLGWEPIPWPSVPWRNLAESERSALMLANMPAGPAWCVFKDASGAVIGYRRARARHPVAQVTGGVYGVGANRFSPQATGATTLYVEAMTDFGDGYGSIAASAGLIFGAAPAAPHPIGALWLPPGGLSAPGPIVASRPLSIEFGRTVRERVRTVLRF